ncbi:MAG TPA: NADH-quinone oxidoreductase subunit F, partial [Alphaproteobacteria bacterium]|nr:NADH-quinone oxidoreductase subunit F [Alphaproteobacteria bacterium]
DILRYDPHLLIEGMIISAFAVGSERGYIYIRGEFNLESRRVEQAIEDAYAKGYLGDNILGKGVRFDLAVHLGAGAYVCGE